MTAHFDHSIATAIWRLDGQADKLLDTYHREIAAKGLQTEKMVPALRFSTSDVGMSGANLYPIFLVGAESRIVPLGYSIRTEHKNGVDMQYFEEQLGLVYAQFEKALDKQVQLTQFCMNGEALASIIADAPIKMPPDEDAGHPGSVVASFTAQPAADPPAFSQTATAPQSTQPAQQQVQPPVQQSHAPAPEPPKTLDEYLRVMTIEQAKAVKVDFGRFSGWSLGEIAMKSPGDLAWYVKNYSGHNIALKAGATKLLETVGQMAS